MVCVAVRTFGLSGPKQFGSDEVWSSDTPENRASDLCSVGPSLTGEKGKQCSVDNYDSQLFSIHIY